jgi:hypothetical protein
MMASPTSRSLALLRKCGHHADVTERWLPYANVRKDLFGCIDLVAVRLGEPGVLGVQSTTAGNLAARVKKARQQPELRTWLATGNRYQCHGCHKRAGKWQLKIVELAAQDLAAVVVGARRRTARRAVQREMFE